MEEFWNKRYADTEFAYGTSPNKFFAEQLEKYQPKGAALFAAAGEGRNAVFAASSGLRVDAFDLSVEGKKKADQLALLQEVEINYTVGELSQLNYSAESFDLLVLIYAHFAANLKASYNRQLANLVRPGGLVVFEAFGSQHIPLRAANPSVGGPGNIEMLFSVEEVQAIFSDFTPLLLEEVTVDLNEGIYHQGRASVVRFVGRKH